jgi:polysaccharide pyruvyl transferase WcaK-like protein
VPVNERKAKENAQKEISDNGVVREAIIEAVRNHGMKVLLCAEQRSEMPLISRALLKLLPEDVRVKCVTLDEFWSPDLALGVYEKCRCVFGIEMHSQVMALGRGVPACVFRHSGFGTKSGMLADLGIGDWCIDIDEEGARDKAAKMVGSILANRESAAERCRELRRRLNGFTI